MGYSTDFDGFVTIKPPLNAAEIKYLQAFSETRHMHREQGPFYVEFNHTFETSELGVFDYNTPYPGQPGLWCNLEPSLDGKKLVWTGSEKTYELDKWVQYLIDCFLKPKALASEFDLEYFKDFTFDHVCKGEMLAQGEDMRDRWLLKVVNNKVTKKKLR